MPKGQGGTAFGSAEFAPAAVEVRPYRIGDIGCTAAFAELAVIGVAAEGGGMAAKSAGVLVYRKRAGEIEVLLVHPGGPFWARRDSGAWSIPKGEYADSEDPEAAARREFTEETGWAVEGDLTPLGEIRQKAGKVVTAFAAEGDFDPASLESNSFEMEWPPKSGRNAVSRSRPRRLVRARRGAREDHRRPAHTARPARRAGRRQRCGLARQTVTVSRKPSKRSNSLFCRNSWENPVSTFLELL